MQILPLTHCSLLAFPSNYSFWIFNFVSRVSSIGTLNQILKVFAFPPCTVTYFKYKVNFCLTLDVLKCSCAVYGPQMYGFFSVLKYKLYVTCLAPLEIVLNVE